jgi:hypothetical protein
MDALEQDLPGEEHSAEDQVPLMLHIYIHSSSAPPSDYITIHATSPPLKPTKNRHPRCNRTATTPTSQC